MGFVVGPNLIFLLEKTRPLVIAAFTAMHTRGCPYRFFWMFALIDPIMLIRLTPLRPSFRRPPCSRTVGRNVTPIGPVVVHL